MSFMARWVYGSNGVSSGTRNSLHYKNRMNPTQQAAQSIMLLKSRGCCATELLIAHRIDPVLGSPFYIGLCACILGSIPRSS